MSAGFEQRSASLFDVWTQRSRALEAEPQAEHEVEPICNVSQVPRTNKLPDPLCQNFLRHLPLEIRVPGSHQEESSDAR
jgi:hypothetical protein